MCLVSYANTHRDVTDLVNHGMLKNTKTWISWERNIVFLQNIKFLNLCLRWHIWKSYRFVALNNAYEFLYGYIISSLFMHFIWKRTYLKFGFIPESKSNIFIFYEVFFWMIQTVFLFLMRHSLLFCCTLVTLWFFPTWNLPFSA